MTDEQSTTQAEPPVVETEKPTPREILRAFEEKHLPDVGRIGGEIEKGSGSPFSFLTPEQRREYAAIEQLIHAEQSLNVAASVHAQAQAVYDGALALVELMEI